MFRPLLALLCIPLCFAAKSSPTEELAKLATAGNGVIRLDERVYDILTSPKRTWSASIQFTALNPQRRCAPCKEFDPSFNAVAKAWAAVAPEHRDNHFFATAEFEETVGIFQRLQISSAPIVHVYPAAEGPKARNVANAPFKYDFSSGFEAGPLAEQLSIHTPIPIPYKAPINWSKIGTFVSLIPIVTLIFRFIRPVIQNRWVWAAGTILVSLVMTAGYMFTRIRGVPHIGHDGSWIAAGYQNQFGQEVQVVAMIYGILGGSFLMLTIVTPYQKSPARQRTQVYLWTAVNFIVFSILVSLFRIKNRGYPFKLMF
ncbi:oligosaccharyl transferase subunit OST3/OST6 family [Paxillus ammoniavirescens]|nr:oligosaccharyl transferase subunit OST3/OST6 family [Paxillus ammoniavirescens]